MGKINYYLNGVDIREFGLHVSAAKGLISMPERKEGISHSYDNEHGICVDVPGFVKERKITLSCFTDKLDPYDFLDTLNTFKLWLLEAGMFQLVADLGGGRPLVYMVYQNGKCDITPKYDASARVGTFDISLVEPEPVKMVWEVELSSFNESFEFYLNEYNNPSNQYVKLYWGDGDSDTVTPGDYIAHVYDWSPNKKYYPVITNPDPDIDYEFYDVEVGSEVQPVNILWNTLL